MSTHVNAHVDTHAYAQVCAHVYTLAYTHVYTQAPAVRGYRHEYACVWTIAAPIDARRSTFDGGS